MFFSRSWVAISIVLVTTSNHWMAAQESKPTSGSLLTVAPRDGGFGIYRPGEPIVWNVRLNQSGTNFHASYVVRDWRGEVQEEGDDLRATDGGVQIICKPKRLGWFELTVKLLDSSNHVQDQKSTTFSIEPQTHSPRRYFHYGISSHTAQYSGKDFDGEIRLLADSGADIVRTDFSWNTIQPSPEAWNYQVFDKLVDSLAVHKIEAQAILSYTARWATTGDPNDKDFSEWARVAPKLNPYVTFATKSVNHYKGRVRFWEIWNEPDIGFWQSPTEKYTELFNATSKAIKQASPEVSVLNGGFAMVSRQPNPNFIHDFLKGADPAHWDIWAYHDYQTFPQMLSRNREHQQLYKTEGISIPVWINEGGFHDLNTGGENEEAITLVKKYTAAPVLGVSAYIWYDLRDDGVSPKEPEHHFGLAHHDFHPKPAFAAYQVLVHQVANRRFEKQLADVPAGVFALLYRGDKPGDENVLVLWREGKDRSTPLWLNLPITTTSAYDIMGNPLPCISYASGSLLNVSDTPLYLHFRGLDVPQIRPVLSTPDNIVLAAGSPTEVSAQILNPSNHTEKTSISIQAKAQGVTFAPANQMLTIAPNQAAAFHTQASLAPSADTTSGMVTIRALEMTSHHAVEAAIPYSTALIIPRLQTVLSGTSIPSDQGLLLTLADRDHIHNLYNAEPSPEMHWHGPEDMSATTRIACDASALYLEADIRDDVHRQTHHGKDLWQGDSLQFAIRTRETQTDHLEAIVALAGNSPEGWIFSKPADSNLSSGRMGSEMPIAVRREGDHTIYSIRIPWATLGLTSAPTNGFRFNFIVNDDDGKGRKQWLRISSGMGDEMNPSLFNMFVCR